VSRVTGGAGRFPYIGMLPPSTNRAKRSARDNSSQK